MHSAAHMALEVLLQRYHTRRLPLSWLIRLISCLLQMNNETVRMAVLVAIERSPDPPSSQAGISGLSAEDAEIYCNTLIDLQCIQRDEDGEEESRRRAAEAARERLERKERERAAREHERRLARSSALAARRHEELWGTVASKLLTASNGLVHEASSTAGRERSTKGMPKLEGLAYLALCRHAVRVGRPPSLDEISRARISRISSDEIDQDGISRTELRHTSSNPMSPTKPTKPGNAADGMEVKWDLDEV